MSSWPWAALAVLLITPVAHAEGHALIVTNNRSLDLARPDLQYADDDGAKWAELFGDIIGPDVTLLSELDIATRALHPQLADIAAPTRTNLDAAAQQLRARLEADTTRPRVVYLVFAGHGDVADGQGFLELADQRFTATDLEALVATLPAERIHLVMDACNAWFMLHPRKPGAKRYTREVVATGLLDRHPNVGALLSTSAEAVAWEWSEIQSGIFSHVARSGLRGAADADRNGVVDYAEIEAWLAIAHASIENEAYRPRIFAQAPKDDAPLVDLHGPGRDVTLPLEHARRITVRDERGLRIMDLNLEAGAPLSLRLPAAPLALTETAPTTPRPTAKRLLLPARATTIDAITEPTATATRGELFEKLFDEPFGSQSIAEWRSHPRPATDAPYGVTQRDAERLGNVLETGARIELRSREFGGILSIGMGAGFLCAGIGVASDADDRDRDAEVLGLTLGTVGVVTLITGAVITAVPGDLEDLAAEYRLAPLGSETDRANSVATFELRLEEAAASYRRVRQLVGITMGIVGLVMTSYGVTSIERDGIDLVSGTMLGGGMALMGIGAWHAFSNRHAIEETWQLYQDIREIPWEPGSGPTVAPVLAPIDGGFLVGVDGRF